MGDIFSQLFGNKMAHADGWKCSSEWSTNTINVPDRDVLKVVAAVMDYALRLFFLVEFTSRKGDYKTWHEHDQRFPLLEKQSEELSYTF